MENLNDLRVEPEKLERIAKKYQKGVITSALTSSANYIRALETNIEQYRGALGYKVSGDIKENPNIKNGIAEALENQIKNISKSKEK